MYYTSKVKDGKIMYATISYYSVEDNGTILDKLELNEFQDNALNALLSDIKAVVSYGLDGRGNNYYTLYSDMAWDKIPTCSLIAILHKLSKLRNGKYYNGSLTYHILEVNTLEDNGSRTWHRLDLSPVRT